MIEILEDGSRQMLVEDLWKRVRRWGKRNGHEVTAYGVTSVAPT